MVSSRPVGLPAWTLPERQQALIPTPVDMITLLVDMVVLIGVDKGVTDYDGSDGAQTVCVRPSRESS